MYNRAVRKFTYVILKKMYQLISDLMLQICNAILAVAYNQIIITVLLPLGLKTFSYSKLLK